MPLTNARLLSANSETESAAGPDANTAAETTTEDADEPAEPSDGNGARGRPNEPFSPNDVSSEKGGDGRTNTLINVVWTLASMLLGTLIACAYCVMASREERRAQQAETLLQKTRLEQRKRAASATVRSLSRPLATADGDCSVCLAPLEDGKGDAVVLGCGHAFHAECLEAWLCSRFATDPDTELTCPLCRAACKPVDDIEAPPVVVPTPEMDGSCVSAVSEPVVATPEMDGSYYSVAESVLGEVLGATHEMDGSYCSVASAGRPAPVVELPVIAPHPQA